MCRNQRAYVRLDGGFASGQFPLLRGVQQGDPLSPIFFNNVTRAVFNELKSEWQRRGYGVNVGSDFDCERKLTHIMFADDAALMAVSR